MGVDYPYASTFLVLRVQNGVVPQCIEDTTTGIPWHRACLCDTEQRCRHGYSTVPRDGTHARAREQMVDVHIVLGGRRSSANGEGLSTSRPSTAEATAQTGAAPFSPRRTQLHSTYTGLYITLLDVCELSAALGQRSVQDTTCRLSLETGTCRAPETMLDNNSSYDPASNSQ